MIDVTFTINGHDWSDKLSTYDVTHNIEYSDSLTALDGTEYAASRIRPIITTSFIPLSDDESAELYNDLSLAVVNIVYSNPHFNENQNGEFRVMANLSATFGIRSVNGKRYYKGDRITFRQRTVL